MNSQRDRSDLKVTVFTGSRAEYGLLKPLMSALEDDPFFNLQILISGTHLSPEYGFTCNEIEDDGFKVDEKVEILLSADSSIGVCKSMGLGLIGFGEAFARLKPDLLVILGDRFETFGAATAALIHQIPIAHIHGGEITKGAMDNQFRNSITKMSHLHFTSTESYRQRIIQMGESPETVFYVGALGVENIKNLDLLSRESFEKDTGISIHEKTLLLTYHPETLGHICALSQLKNLFGALDQFPKMNLIFTKSNADEQGRLINEQVDRFCDLRKNAVAVTSLGQIKYLSALNHCLAVVGNSSSGIIEAPSLKVPTVNIGTRQDGRVKAASIIDCDAVQDDIVRAISKAISPKFSKYVGTVMNPYEKEGTVKIIKQILGSVRLDNIIRKQFHDLIN